MGAFFSSSLCKPIDRTAQLQHLLAGYASKSASPTCTRLAARMASDWYALSGAQALRASSAVSFREYARRARSPNRSTPALEDDRRQIDLDLARARASVREFILCVPDNSSDNEEEEDGEDEALAPHLAMLRDILLAYSVVRLV